MGNYKSEKKIVKSHNLAIQFMIWLVNKLERDLDFKRNLGIEVALRSFEINKNQGFIELFHSQLIVYIFKSAGYLHF